MWDPDKQTQIELQTHNKERDLGVHVDNQLKFHSHTRNMVSKSNAGHGLLKRSVTSRSPRVFLRLYNAVKGPNLDFRSCIATPQYFLEDITPRLKDLPYNER